MGALSGFRPAVVNTIRWAGPSAWPLLARMPLVGKYALAQILAANPPARRACPPGLVALIPGLSEGEVSARTQADRLLAPLRANVWEGGIPWTVQLARYTDFSGMRAAIIAHWDPDGVLDVYVLRYAGALKAMGYTVVVATDRPLRFAGAVGALPEALPPEIDAVVCRNCQGYDFTSWRAAFCAFPSLFAADELLLTNDSIFAPVGDLGAVHHAMEQVDCDFWGMVESHDKQPHLQGCCVVLRRAAAGARAFRDFWPHVGPVPSKERAIGCELGLSLWLAAQGLRAGAYSPAANQLHPLLNPTHLGWEFLLDDCGAPFIKRDLLFQNPYRISLQRVESALLKKGFPVRLILDYASRCGLPVRFPATAGAGTQQE